LMATVATLFAVPVIYSVLRSKLPTKHLMEERFRQEKQGAEADRSAA